MRWAVLQFPGSNCDQDAVHVLKNVLGQDVKLVWHKETSLAGMDAVVVPGGFSYGDYLRCGAIARFSPIMPAVRQAAAEGKTVLGICNGFQILCEAGLLPGVLLRNAGLHFRCEVRHLKVENTRSRFTSEYAPGQILRLPIAHGEGNYVADEATLDELFAHRQVLLTYSDAQGGVREDSNPNGSSRHIAGLMNRTGNVMGLMPHPERASEAILGSADGRGVFESILSFTQAAAKKAA
jgi:phosphoribosylformylglycinamidine synthase